MDICYISCALDTQIDFMPDNKGLVIGADKGYLNLVKSGIKPHIVVGDFDSYDGEIECENIVRLPKIKDETDGEVAIKYAIENGYKNIIVYGAIGGFLDHTLANVAHLRKYTEKGAKIAFIDGENVLFAIHNEKISFSNDTKGRISVFSATEKSEKVTLKGLFYELENATLYNAIPLGVSNEFVGKSSEISVANGTLYIYTSKENFGKILTNN